MRNIILSKSDFFFNARTTFSHYKFMVYVVHKQFIKADVMAIHHVFLVGLGSR